MKSLDESLLEEVQFLATYLQAKTSELSELKQKTQEATVQASQLRTQNQQLLRFVCALSVSHTAVAIACDTVTVSQGGTANAHLLRC